MRGKDIKKRDFNFLLLRAAADLDAKSVKHHDKQTTLQN